jgi:hypothetical protein
MLLLTLQAHLLFSPEHSKQLLHQCILILGHPAHDLAYSRAVHDHWKVQLACGGGKATQECLILCGGLSSTLGGALRVFLIGSDHRLCLD